MLLIDGSDCLGKTEFAKKIVRKISDWGHPVIYGWMTRPNEQLFDFFLDYKKLIHPYLVQDRFHLSGLAYHNNKISCEKLQMINGWIRGAGGLIIILYASDEEHYEQRIREDKRGNILSWPILCQANSYYKRFVEEDNDCDWAFDIIPKNKKEEQEQIQYVSENCVNLIAREWITRRQLLGF